MGIKSSHPDLETIEIEEYGSKETKINKSINMLAKLKDKYMVTLIFCVRFSQTLNNRGVALFQSFID